MLLLQLQCADEALQSVTAIVLYPSDQIMAISDIKSGTEMYMSLYPEQSSDKGLRLGNIVPDFKAETTQGPMNFHEWKKGKYAHAERTVNAPKNGDDGAREVRFLSVYAFALP